MSTLTIFARGDRALMLSDTAGTTSDLTVRAWVNKVATVPHLKMALTVQGAAEAVGTFANRLASDLGSFDAIVRDGAGYLAEEHADNAARWESGTGLADFRLGLVGWSEERRRFDAYYLQSRDADGAPAFTFVRRDLVMAPELDPADIVALQIPKDGTAFSADAQAYLLRIMAVQRHATTPRLGGGEPGHVVGGQVVATELTRTGITQRVVHAWPDRLGEPIQPAPLREELGAVMQIAQPAGAANVVHMSRQQRRAAERAS